MKCNNGSVRLEALSPLNVSREEDDETFTGGPEAFSTRVKVAPFPSLHFEIDEIELIFLTYFSS